MTDTMKHTSIKLSQFCYAKTLLITMKEEMKKVESFINTSLQNK